jgi:hypothetical protein
VVVGIAHAGQDLGLDISGPDGQAIRQERGKHRRGGPREADGRTVSAHSAARICFHEIGAVAHQKSSAEFSLPLKGGGSGWGHRATVPA